MEAGAGVEAEAEDGWCHAGEGGSYTPSEALDLRLVVNLKSLDFGVV